MKHSTYRRHHPRCAGSSPHSRKLTIEALEDRCLLATVAVTNTLDVVNGDTTSILDLLNDDGDDGISLREAILAANATAGMDFIDFNIPMSDDGFDPEIGVWTIFPTAQLPAIMDAVEINGYSQSGASENTDPSGINAVLTVEIDGVVAGFGVIGLDVTAGDSTIRGLVINGFSNYAIHLDGAGGNFIEGNFLGTDPIGTLAVGSRAGVSILNSINNTIGGSSPEARNLISGNFGSGIEITNEASTGNMVQGNLIGTDKSGTFSVPNQLDGVLLTGEIELDGYATDNVIGGAGEGEGNVISGNGRHGVQIVRGTFNRVEGNFIGTNVAGSAPVANEFAGVRIAEGADNVIGGTEVLAENVISGNLYGVEIVAGLSGLDVPPNPRHAQRNKIQGNLIGTDGLGFDPIRNVGGGVLLHTLPDSTVTVFDNTIGGTMETAGNTISGNGTAGVVMSTPSVVGNKLQGNYIGTTVNGGQALANQGPGVEINLITGIEGAPTLNVIGGTEPGAGNLISGNLTDGVQIANGASANRVQGNLIGTSSDGTQELGNQRHGINVSGGILNIVGGYDGDDGEQDGVVLARNVISGNASNGVVFGTSIEGAVASGNVVIGNYIGTNAQGTAAVANNRGVEIEDALGNIIGTAPPEGPVIITTDIPDGANLISGNLELGVLILGELATGNRVDANRIGTNKTATGQIGNGTGIYVQSAPANFIGSATAGGGNVIGGNLLDGVTIRLDAAEGNVLHNNRIGYVDNDGESPVVIPNQGFGVNITNAPANLVGGTGPDERNVISGNGASGVAIQGPLAVANQVQGNFIGTDKDGMLAVPNLYGVFISNASNNNVGDGQPGARNVISGNAVAGVLISGEDADNNKIQGNLIGANAAGSAEVPNNAGVAIIGGANGNFIGIDGDGADDAAERNVISGNLGIGVQLTGVETDANHVEGNYIGTAFNGEDPLPNAQQGVFVLGANQTFITGNTIAFNGEALELKGHGVVIAAGLNNQIRQNSIHSNAGRGIDLGNNTLLESINDVGDTDSGANQFQNYPVVSRVEFLGSTKQIWWQLDVPVDGGYIFEFFSNTAPDPSGFGEGEKYLFTEIQNSVDRTILFPIEVDASETYISATVTDPMGNTSEFSMVDTDGDALADAWEMPDMDGIDINEDGIRDFEPLSSKGASYLHKDIFVEIDAMKDRAPSQDALDLVAFGRPTLDEGFAHAPNSLVQNPDDLDGINLHLEMEGDVNIPRQPWSDLDTENDNWPREFDRIKNGGAEQGYPDGRFGTPDERDMNNWPAIRAARWLVYHYAIFADSIPSRDHLGKGEFGGNDFYAILGNSSTRAGNSADQAAVLMHELGHNLGLQHGGADESNFKPNYYSIMNYTWSFKPGHPEYQFGFAQGWRLDYSRVTLLPLNESALLEPLGFGGDPNLLVPIGPVFEPPLTLEVLDLVAMGGEIDLNGDGDTNDSVNRNINFITDENGDGVIDGEDELKNLEEGPTLVGYVDWSRLKYNFTASSNFASNVHENLEQQPYTVELFEQLNATGFGPGVFQFSHDFYDELEASGEATIRVVRGGGTDGTATVEYSVTADTATAGEDFTVVSGVLEFAEGEFRKTFTIPLVDEDNRELDESVILTLETPTGGAELGGRDTAVLNILNDDLPSLVGDYNENGVVDAADYIVWRGTLGTYTAAFNGADASGNGFIDHADYDVWKMHFGETLPPQATGGGTVATALVESPASLSAESAPDGGVSATARAAGFALIASPRQTEAARHDPTVLSHARASTTSRRDGDLLLLAVARLRQESARIQDSAEFNELSKQSRERLGPIIENELLPIDFSLERRLSMTIPV